jgi:hypothetical protein
MEITGLPVHPLVVHAVVVLLPLAVLLGLAFAFLPTWRWLTRWLTLACTVAAVAAVFVARQSGHAFLEGKPFLLQASNPARQHVIDHQNYANLLWWVSLVFLLVVVLAFVLLPGPTGLADGRLDHAGSASALAVRGLPVLLAVAGIATLVLCVLTGDAGARSVWGS